MKETVASAALAGAAANLAANPLGLPIGSQTYPHRARIKAGDFAGLCADMKALGIGSIELCSPGYGEFAGLADAKQTRKIIEDHGLQCPSSHFSLRELRTKLEPSIEWAKEIGMTQMGTATLSGHAENGVATMDVVKHAADEYNHIAETISKAGLTTFLHDERFEMSKVDGKLVYQVLIELLDPKLVKMQFQMSATPTVGDPVMYFKKYPGRFISAHLQGVDLNAPPQSPAVAVGKDGLDWPKIFKAAKKGGMKNYFIEQTWDLTVQGVAYLKTLKV
ncbi:MAG TPA: sugar phosphate isomerase/epimerase [Bryobacteraceae bacterium]|jgi:sugar phosphate isomerase/epimerase